MARRNPLVCQFVEKLSSTALEKYRPLVRELVGRRHGVYALYRRDKLYYVGLAKDLKGRLGAHLGDRHKGLWDRFSVYLTIDDSHMKELESLIIRIVKPDGNRQSGKFAHAENLMRTIQGRIRRIQEDERLDILGRRRRKAEPGPTKVRRGKLRSGGHPLLGGYIDRAITLRTDYKGKTYKARVRKNGTIRAGRQVYASPTLAATALVGKRVNGWAFWRYERAPGQWVRLKEIRRG